MRAVADRELLPVARRRRRSQTAVDRAQILVGHLRDRAGASAMRSRGVAIAKPVDEAVFRENRSARAPEVRCRHDAPTDGTQPDAPGVVALDSASSSRGRLIGRGPIERGRSTASTSY